MNGMKCCMKCPLKKIKLQYRVQNTGVQNESTV